MTQQPRHLSLPTAEGDARPADTRRSETKRGEARRRAFLDAAREVFLSQGYVAASVNDVVRIAGGSLATLYAQFGSKEGLFLAMLDEAIQTALAPLGEIAASHRPLREGLQAIGETFLERVISPGGTAMYRLVISEGAKFPAVVLQYQALGPDRVRGIVRSYLEERQAAGEVVLTDADAAATAFLDLVASTYRARAAWDPAFTMDEAQRRAHVTRAVELFVSGVAPR